MIKYITFTLIAFLALGCQQKIETIQPETATQESEMTIVDIQSEAYVSPVTTISSEKKTNVVKTLRKDPVLPADFKEEKKLKAMPSNIPTTCQMWSDGCNTCTRAGNNKASCTVYDCTNKIKFSCLQWN